VNLHVRFDERGVEKEHTSGDFLAAGRMIGGLEIPTLFVMEGGYDVAEVGVNVANLLKGFEDQNQED
jgi:acetoin utilization deacetylase AcuC-like enzyme